MIGETEVDITFDKISYSNLPKREKLNIWWADFWTTKHAEDEILNWLVHLLTISIYSFICSLLFLRFFLSLLTLDLFPYLSSLFLSPLVLCSQVVTCWVPSFLLPSRFALFFASFIYLIICFIFLSCSLCFPSLCLSSFLVPLFCLFILFVFLYRLFRWFSYSLISPSFTSPFRSDYLSFQSKFTTCFSLLSRKRRSLEGLEPRASIS
jgi:hypothetical protein